MPKTARILLIEDEVEIRELLAAMLRRNGHTVTTAPSGLYVVRNIDSVDFAAAFDIVITDIIMPDVDGIEVIRRLRDIHPACKIIAMSGGGRFQGSDDYLKLAERFRVETTLAKPFSRDELYHAVDRVMQAA